MYYIGFDPGKQGYYTIINENKNIIEYHLLYDKKKDEFYLDNIIELSNKYKESIIILEKQQAYTGQGVSSTFQTGYGFGLLYGLLYKRFNNILIINPIKWHNELVNKLCNIDEKIILKNKNYKELLKYCNKDYVDFYNDRINLKSLKDGKKSTYYLFMKSNLYNQINKKEWKDNNLIDSIMISYYGYLIKNKNPIII